MADRIHIPILRAGVPYRSLQTEALRDVRTGEPVGEMSLATGGMISRDQLRAAENRRALERFSVAELLEICKAAGNHFLEAELPLGEGTQTPEDYLRQLASTTGMPEAMGRANMAKIVSVLEGMEEVLGGLTRGLDLRVLDGGWGLSQGRKLSYLRQADALGAVLPNNSPGVHSLWLPAVPLKVPLVLKPGSTEPWTPYRIAQAFLAAGCPPEAFSFYPADRGAGQQVLLSSRRSMIFGDQSTVDRWKDNPRVQPHGPGWSKVVFGPDLAGSWRDHLDLLITSIAANGGRSCINASGVWTPAHGRELAEALAERLAAFEARPLDDPAAELAAFAQPEIARRLNEILDHQLAQPGAVDLTARHRRTGRLAEAGGCTFLLPTLVWCEDPCHPLAQAEYGFPFAAVVEVPREKILDAMGSTLVATAITDDPAFRDEVLAAEGIDRLNLGPIPTPRISWDQPHEGNLFDHLYRQRAFQAA